MSSYRSSNTRRPSGDASQFGGYRVYVGDIGQRIGRTDLEKEFGQYGPVTDVWMGKKRDANAQDYAFVVFRYPEDADEAVRDRNGRKIAGRTVKVEHAKPVGSNMRRGRGNWGGGNRDYNSYQRNNNYRRASPARERSGGRRSRSQSPVRSNRSQQSPSSSRRRYDNAGSSVPKKMSKRSPSDSPDARPVKSKKSRRQSSSSASPPPQSKSNQRVQDSDSDHSSPSPPQKPKKKQRSWTPSQSPNANDEYDARQYQKSQDDREDVKKAKSSKNKSKGFEQREDYSSDDY